MDIREKINKLVSGEIDLKEYTSNYEKKLKQQQEEKLKQQRQQRNAERVQNVINKRNETANTFKSNKINLPISKEFKQQLETGKRVQVPEKYSLPTFVDNVKKKQKGAIGYIGKRTGAGTLQGVTGIAQAGTTEVASNLEKGNKKSAVNVGINFLNSINGIMNPVQTLNDAVQKMPTLIGNTIKTVTDKDKNVLEKASAIVTNAVSEGVNDNPAKKIVNAGTQLAGKILPSNASEEVLKLNDKISQPVENLNAQLEAERNNYGKLTQTIGDVGQVVGNMVPAMVGTAVTKNPTVGLATMGLSTKGQATQEALNKGATLDEAIKIGDTKAVIEVGTEMLTGGVNIFGKGALDDIVERGIVSKVKNKVMQKLVQQGVNVTGEVLEETISDVLETAIDKGTVNPNASYSIKDWGDTAVTTVLSTLVLNAIGGVGNIKRNKEDKQVQQKLQEAQDLINKVQNEPVNTQTQQITGQENKVAQNGNMEQIKADSENFAKQIDDYISGKIKSSDFINVGKTPQVLQNIGLPNNDIILKQSKLKTILQESGSETSNLHGLSTETLKRIPEAIANPLNVLQSSSNKNSIVVITDLADKLERPVIASIEMDYQGRVGNIDFLSNRLTSAYGKNNYDEFMQREIAKGNLLYDIDEGIIKELPASTRVQFPEGLNSLDSNESIINNSIAQSNENVKSDTDINYNMPNASNNIQNNENINNPNNVPYNKKLNNKTLNPTEIANLNPEQANTTPILPVRNYARGNKESSFLSNITTEAGFLNEDLRHEMAKEDNIRYYKGITNEETLEKAYTELQKGGEQETVKWFNKDNKNTKAEDVAKGWILLKQYQDKGDYQGAVEVAKKMRDMATNAGQTVQAYNILSRLTPEGMFYYAQSELTEAYNKMVQGKSKAWIEENSSKFDLTPEETQLIKEKMESIQEVEDERTKKIALGEIQKIISDKIPPTASQSVKAWMRISMLFNPKTQVRNVMGNAVILPVNMTSDFVSSGLDRIIAKKTGVRTTGNTNIKSYTKGFGKGLYESYDDFRKGINTRNIEGNRFEVSEGKNFKDNGIGKALNKVDNILSFALDVGDRAFYEGVFTNSINNQLVLNNTTEVTQDMINIATNEALQRTWQDNNAYTNAVLKIRKILNFGKGYGLGDVLIPFAKTPANLTKAIVDYSPVGLARTLAVDARRFSNSLENGQYTPQLQHQFVQNIGKGMAGSFLYVLGYALAKAGIATGEADDDKDVKNFMKNSLGISSYSIKIGDKTFTYDWAQPVATPLAIMTNYVKYSKDNPNANAIEKAWKSMNIGTEQLLQQSFMESLNTVLNGSGTTLENLSQAVLELPARAIPTFSKQIADMVDGTQRTTFEYGKPIQSAVNSVKAKLPVISRTLPVTVDTLGNEIKKYGGNNNAWNVMFNPANTNKGQLSKAGEEIYNVYMQTGDTTIFPRTAPYYINSKGEKITMDALQRSEFQKVTGTYVENALDGLLDNNDYKKLSNEKKAEVINQIVSDSYAKAKYDILKIDSEEYKKLRNTLNNVKTNSYYNYKFTTKDMKKNSEKMDVIVNANYTDKEKQTLYENYIKSKDDIKYEIIKGTGLNINSYLKYKIADSNDEFAADKKDNGTVKGKPISNSAKNKIYNYIMSIPGTNYTQRLILYALEYEANNAEKQDVINYVKRLPNKTNEQKLEILSKFKGVTVYKDGTFTY